MDQHLLLVAARLTMVLRYRFFQHYVFAKQPFAFLTRNEIISTASSAPPAYPRT